MVNANRENSRILKIFSLLMLCCLLVWAVDDITMMTINRENSRIFAFYSFWMLFCLHCSGLTMVTTNRESSRIFTFSSFWMLFYLDWYGLLMTSLWWPQTAKLRESLNCTVFENFVACPDPNIFWKRVRKSACLTVRKTDFHFFFWSFMAFLLLTKIHPGSCFEYLFFNILFEEF